MKKIFIAALSLIAGTLASQNFNCLSHDVYTRQMNSDPVFRINQEKLERETQEWISNQAAARPAAAAPQYIIPVVFHVIYTTPAGNISQAQIVDQIEILNKEFNRLQADTILTPTAFRPLATPFAVEFRLATKDPNGNCTNGINRVYSTLTNCSVNENDIKALSYWPSNKYLNIWITQSMHYSGSTDCWGGGYATFPGGTATLDGINIRGDLISNIGTAATNSSWGNFKGRYLIHELGHWFNLRHIWGDANCGNDQVADTPPAVNSNNNCPSFPHNAFNSCGSGASGEMFMNYMDYTNGPCLNMFTAGQVTRMTAAMNSSTSGRNNLWTTANLNATGTNNPYTYPVTCVSSPAVLQNGPIVVCVGDSVKLTDNSYGGKVTSRLWDFGGAASSSTTDSIVKVKYSQPGVYSFTLTNNYQSSSKTSTFANKVYVIGKTPNPAYFVPFEDSFEDLATFYGEWTLVDHANDGVGWELNATTAYTGFNCIGINNYNADGPTIDEAISPAYDLSAVQNPTLTFRLNYTRRNLVNYDQLQVFVSNNCGQTWNSIYLKTANGSLRTFNTDQANSSYTPAIGATDWRLEKINLQPQFVGGTVNFKFAFTSGGGNNIFLDDINIDGDNTTGLNAQQLAGSFRLFPNPAKDQLNIQCGAIDRTSLGFELRDVLGRRCNAAASASASPENVVSLNLRNNAPGIYFLSVTRNGAIVYTGKFVKESAE